MSSSPLHLLRLAMRLYTRPPQEQLLAPPADGDIGRAVRFLPVVGLFVGALFAVVYVMLAQIVPHSVAVVAALGIAALVTGGYHEIGWMRFCDAATPTEGERPHAGGARTTGAMGIVGLLLSLLMKVETLSSLDPSWISVAALAGHPVSRALAVSSLTALNGRVAGGPAVTPASRLIAMIAGLLPLVALGAWLDSYDALASALVPALLMSLLVRHLARRRLAADPQSVLGAGQQLTELAWYIGVLAWWTVTMTAPAETPDE